MGDWRWWKVIVEACCQINGGCFNVKGKRKKKELEREPAKGSNPRGGASQWNGRPRHRDRRSHRGLETTSDGEEYRLFCEGQGRSSEANPRSLTVNLHRRWVQLRKRKRKRKRKKHEWGRVLAWVWVWIWEWAMRSTAVVVVAVLVDNTLRCWDYWEWETSLSLSTWVLMTICSSLPGTRFFLFPSFSARVRVKSRVDAGNTWGEEEHEPVCRDCLIRDKPHNNQRTALLCRFLFITSFVVRHLSAATALILESWYTKSSPNLHGWSI